MEKRELTAADVWAMFAETDRKIAEGHRILDEKLAENNRFLIENFAEMSNKTFAEIRKMFEESRAESRAERQENDRILNEKLAENDRKLTEKFKELGIERRETFRKIAEGHRILDEKLEQSRLERLENDRVLNEKLAENDRKLTEKFEALGIKVKDINSNVVGIGNSNGEYAEEYFYNSLEKKMEFAGVHFDDISTDFKLLRKSPDGKRIEDQFDIVMLNGETAALIEIKYKARKDDPKQIVNQKISNFRFLFPEYAKLKIYLGLAAFSFEESAEQEAKELGIGLLRQVGETIEYETKWVRAY